MRYNFYKQVNNVRSIPVVCGNGLYFLSHPDKKLTCLSKDNLEFLWSTEEIVHSIVCLNEHLLCHGLRIYDLAGKLLFAGDEEYSYEGIAYENLSVWKLVDDANDTVEYCVFNVLERIFLKEKILIEGMPACLFKDSLIIKSENFLKKISLYEGREIWSFDTGQLGSELNKILLHKETEVRLQNVKQVYVRDTKIIVTLTHAVIALHESTGKQLWQIDFDALDPNEIVFDKTFGYLSQGVFYSIIDIEKGKKILERELPTHVEINLNKVHFMNAGSGLVFFDGFLFFTFSELGVRYLIKIEPLTGEFVSGMILDTKAATYKPVFNSNRMYVLSQDRNLLVYEI